MSIISSGCRAAFEVNQEIFVGGKNVSGDVGREKRMGSGLVSFIPFLSTPLLIKARMEQAY